ncbi:MAG: TlyA family RNA methyltransferase [Acidobacteriota bacterium]
MEAKTKKRLDRLMVKRELVNSREKARAMIMAGSVLVNSRRIDKSSAMVDEASDITIKGKLSPFVSRGGEKLEEALKRFSIKVEGKIALDVGASTGGFTDCLLQRGAKRVYALDVGYGQLAWKLRTDQRVVPIERQNVRYIKEDTLPEKVDLVTIDVSFISLKKVIPAVLSLLNRPGEMLCLIKPQFEVGKGEVGKKGVVKDPQKHQRVIKEIATFARVHNLFVKGIIESPILGQEGNKEFFIYLTNFPLSSETDS